MKCSVYKLGFLQNYKYVVIFARYNNKWIICKEKNSETWQTAGGHIEKNETPIQAAKRELFEETGALDFDINPICDYWACDEPHETDNIGSSNGQVFLAYVNKLGNIPENSEIECIDFFDEFPQNLTYPDITYELLPQIITRI
jgi:8-oxo-dGTP diphosphatase